MELDIPTVDIVRTRKIALKDERLLQVGALIYRLGENGLEYMLITSRGTGRFIIPKGWPIPGKTLSQAALIEAFEEAGVSGDIEEAPIGDYTYEKGDTKTSFRVYVYVIHNACEKKKWPERRQRNRVWFSAQESETHVREPGLKQLMAAFSQKMTKTTPLS